MTHAPDIHVNNLECYMYLIYTKMSPNEHELSKSQMMHNAFLHFRILNSLKRTLRDTS